LFRRAQLALINFPPRVLVTTSVSLYCRLRLISLEIIVGSLSSSIPILLKVFPLEIPS